MSLTLYVKRRAGEREARFRWRYFVHGDDVDGGVFRQPKVEGREEGWSVTVTLCPGQLVDQNVEIVLHDLNNDRVWTLGWLEVANWKENRRVGKHEDLTYGPNVGERGWVNGRTVDEPTVLARTRVLHRCLETLDTLRLSFEEMCSEADRFYIGRSIPAVLEPVLTRVNITQRSSVQARRVAFDLSYTTYEAFLSALDERRQPRATNVLWYFSDINVPTLFWNAKRGLWSSGLPKTHRLFRSVDPSLLAEVTLGPLSADPQVLMTYTRVNQEALRLITAVKSRWGNRWVVEWSEELTVSVVGSLTRQRIRLFLEENTGIPSLRLESDGRIFLGALEVWRS